jgi:hypothetical protein
MSSSPARSTRSSRSTRSRAVSDLTSTGGISAVQLIEAAQTRCRTVNACHLVDLVRAGARFEVGKLIERPDAHLVNTPSRQPPKRS